jgi:hypothetical protein
MPGWVPRVLLGLFGCVLALAVAEGALRLLPLPDLTVVETFQPIPDEAWRDPNWSDIPWGRGFRQNPVIGYEHSPNADLRVRLAEHADGQFRFRTNNLGLRRDASTLVEKPPGLTRVLVLGDSHTDGFVENGETFSMLLESLLTQADGSQNPIEVLDAGVAGYSPAEQYLWYEQNGVRLRPDLVISVFYVGNDALDLLNPSKASVDPASGARRPPGPATSTAQGGTAEPRLLQLGRFALRSGPLSEVWRRSGLPGSGAEVAGYPNDVLVQVLRRCFGCYFQSLQQAARAQRSSTELHDAVERAAALLARWDLAAQGRDTRLFVALLPTRAQVEPARARPDQLAVASLLELTESALTLDDQVAATILARLGTAAVPVLDLRPALAGADDQPRYYSVDWHLNPLGHQLVAAALSRALSDRGLWPRR